jgi:hypothetical protein
MTLVRTITSQDKGMYGKTIRRPDNEDNKNREKTMKGGTIEGYNNSPLLYYKIDKMSKIIQRSRDKSMTI